MVRIERQIRGKRFDWYIAIGRGGMVPTCLLAEITGQTNIELLPVKSYNGREKGQIAMVKKNLEHLRGARVLLIDDLVDSGATMAYCKKHLIAMGCEVETAVIVKKEGSRFEPDYFVKEAPGEKWIVFPWEENWRINGQ